MEKRVITDNDYSKDPSQGGCYLISAEEQLSEYPKIYAVLFQDIVHGVRVNRRNSRYIPVDYTVNRRHCVNCLYEWKRIWVKKGIKEPKIRNLPAIIRIVLEE